LLAEPCSDRRHILVLLRTFSARSQRRWSDSSLDQPSVASAMIYLHRINQRGRLALILFALFTNHWFSDSTDPRDAIGRILKGDSCESSDEE
jgi:hypothetical protein